MRSRFVFRIRMIALFFVLLAVVFFARLYFVQIIRGQDYRAEAEAQYVKQVSNQIDRGTIYFIERNGKRIAAATLASGYTIALNPDEVTDPEKAYTAIAELIPDLTHSSFIEKASKEDDVYEEVRRQVPDEAGRAIAELELDGVQVLRESWRYYPGDELAAHAVGFLGYGGDGVTLTGQYGLERFYNEALTKTGGLYVNFFADLFTNIRSRFSSGKIEPGADLVTSIEPSVQYQLEEILRRYGEAWHPRTSGGIVMDPKTGAVIAMAARPTYDLNDFKNAGVESYSNPLTENLYEFGSTMKPLTMAAAIETGAVTPLTIYDDKGSIVIDGKKISNFDGKARGVVPMQEVLSQSLNVGIAFIVQRMGTGVLKEYFQKYGLTEETGIDLPSEASPLVSNFQSPRMVEYVNAGFGQGIAITPVAMTRALATLANGGQVPSPRVGVKLDYGGGLTREVGWSPPRQAGSPETAEVVTRMLVAVVDEALKGGTVKIPEYSVAAKTGTAQIAKPGGGGYYDDRYLHSFFGYFPAYEPKFIVFFFAMEPKGAKYASETWTDPFMETVRFLTTYYDIPPDRVSPLR
ncbi:MAG: penicillin-binding protein 2 [Patescibacteria group bacterium]